MKTPLVSFDLGEGDTRDQRLKMLEALTKRFGATCSVLLQKLADGELVVSAREEAPEGTSGEVLLDRIGSYGFSADDIRDIEAAISELRASQMSER